MGSGSRGAEAPRRPSVGFSLPLPLCILASPGLQQETQYPVSCVLDFSYHSQKHGVCFLHPILESSGVPASPPFPAGWQARLVTWPLDSSCLHQELLKVYGRELLPVSPHQALPWPSDLSPNQWLWPSSSSPSWNRAESSSLAKALRPLSSSPSSGWLFMVP